MENYFGNEEYKAAKAWLERANAEITAAGEEFDEAYTENTAAETFYYDSLEAY